MKKGIVYIVTAAVAVFIVILFVNIRSIDKNQSGTIYTQDIKSSTEPTSLQDSQQSKSYWERANKSFQSTLDYGMLAMKKNAGKLPQIPDAIIGIKINTLHDDHGVTVIMTGTAVTFKK